MGNKGRGVWLRALRRGVGLALALVAVWGIGITADFSGAGAVLQAWSQSPAVIVGLFSSQLNVPPADTVTAGMDGWGRLLLGQSALLSAGREEVARWRQEQGENGGEQPPLDGEDHDDLEEPQLQPPQRDEGIIEMTGRGKTGSQYIQDGEIYLYNRTDKALEAGILTRAGADITLGDAPQILIVHTHGSEAYSQTDGEYYQESDPYRTTDCTHNMVRVGEEMARVFREQGFEVVHDTNLYDYPAYNGAYDRSKAAVEQWLKQYPTIQLVLDVHRDALVGSDGSIYKLVSQEGGQKVAQVMFVVGSDGSGLEHPRWQDNLALAVRFQRRLVEDYASLARPIVLRNSRYNQQLLPGSLLVEVGGHGNTLTEALAGARLFARGVGQELLTMKG